MIILDEALKQRAQEGRPIRVGMVGAGYMGQGVAMQLMQVVPGMNLVAVSNRDVKKAIDCVHAADLAGGLVRECASASEVEAAIADHTVAVTADAFALCAAGNIDVVVDVTGAVEFGTQVAIAAIDHGKHLCTMNVEVDATVGLALQRRAEHAGVLYTVADGDQPGVEMNLVRYVRGIGFRPVLCGNIKGLQDPYRNPTTQAEFARKHGQQAHMVTSFADGSKISFEQACVANAMGMNVGVRGMHGPTVERGTPVAECIELYPQEQLLEGPGIVDYVVGAAPAPGVYVYAVMENEAQRPYLSYYKLGDGPIYAFHHPTHLCHLEVANSIGRLMCFEDVTLAPRGHHVDVVAVAKRDLAVGEVLDGIGWYMTYGQCENADIVNTSRLLPMGLAEGCTLVRAVKKDAPLSYNDVKLPEGRIVDQLRSEMA